MKELRFGHISDIHWPGDVSRLKGNMLKCVEAGGDPAATLTVALRELSEESIDFLIVTGDICHEGTPDDYADVRELFDKYLPGVPRLCALGNHDVREAFRQGFLGDRYGGTHPYCDRLDVDGLRILSVDSAWEKKLEGSLDDKQLDWLEEQLADQMPRGSILLFHNPISPQTASMELTPRFERILRGGDFIGLFNGHIHRSCTDWAAGIPHYTCQATGFDIEVNGIKKTAAYTTRGGYNLCVLRDGGEFFVESRIASPKGTIFLTK